LRIVFSGKSCPREEKPGGKERMKKRGDQTFLFSLLTLPFVLIEFFEIVRTNKINGKLMQAILWPHDSLLYKKKPIKRS
jgi:hypothetical protein